MDKPLDVYDIMDIMLECADKDQLDEYYETTELQSIGRFLVDSGLGAVEVDVDKMIRVLSKIQKKRGESN